VPGTTQTAVIFSGGDPPGPDAVADLPKDRFVIAADSGLEHARDLAIRVDLVVGDLDSVDPATLAAAEAEGTPVERHPADKDRTDGELALAAALDRGCTDVLVVGGFGGRVDHWLANVAMWASPAWADLRIEVRSGSSRVAVVRDRYEIDAPLGELVTLLAAHGPVTGITTTGLRFPLDHERLEPGSSRGVSNEVDGPGASVTVGTGTLLVIRPGERVR
jgi:thiamine pyrophosphokinase